MSIVGKQRSLESAHAFRTADASIEVTIATSDTADVDELIAAVRDYWAALRKADLAAGNPVKIFVDATDVNSVIWAFRWRRPTSRLEARADDVCVEAFNRIVAASGGQLQRYPFAHEVYQGFESQRFPGRGGIELLRGKCTCTVRLDGFDAEFELDGQNGFVIMHRGPRLDLRGVHLMPVTLVAHGADAPNPLAGDPGLREVPEPIRTAPFRVEQNTELPQFGIIRSLSADADFPAMAMWVVHWRVHTPMGTIITDPAQPLVFGPTVVKHYPPVGTEFFSATGPVAALRADTGERVGTLTPGQLTAFDIVVTMDDEIPSVYDRPAKYHIDMFNRYVGDPELQIATEGLVDDFRVPAEPSYGSGRPTGPDGDTAGNGEA